MTLSLALSPLAQFRQFINWDFFPVPGKAKPTKVTITPDGTKANAHDPANWLTYDEALATGKRVGFVLTAADPFFLFDVDDCKKPDGTWNELVDDALLRFPGAACEVSVSGKGLHFIGQCSALPPHMNKFQHLGKWLEFYTDKRFIALGDQSSAVGYAATDCTQALAAFIPPRTTVASAEWTSEPSAEWDGPSDDEELIRRMLASRPSVNSALGKGSTVQQLWAGDVDALSQTYPPVDGEGDFNHSSADMALSTHLAFWTGRDCGRMHRLFLQSGLTRPKYEEREDYQLRTHTAACGLTTNVYNGGGENLPAVAPTMAPAGTEVALGEVRGTSEWMNVDAQLPYFAGCVYVRDVHKVLVPDGGMLTPAQFKATFGGFTFAMNDGTDKPSNNAFECFTENRAISYPKAHRAAFRPDVPPLHVFKEEGLVLVNTYVPIETDSAPGDVTPFLNHVALLIPDERDRAILLAYMAAVVQFPGDKFQWSPVVQGAEGNGKSLLSRCIERAVGMRYTHRPRADDISNKFNDWATGNLFIAIEEVNTSNKREVLEILKPLITDSRIEIQGKGDNQVTGDNRANYFMTTNHKDGLPKQEGDRRYAIFFCPQQSAADIHREGWGDNSGYFPGLYRWLNQEGGQSHVTHFLQTYAIPAELNPALNNGGLSHRAPKTSSTLEALSIGLGRIEQAIIEKAESGAKGFIGDWVSSWALNKFLTEELRANGISMYKRSEILKTLGYVKHPALRAGRAGKALMQEEGSKPMLYVKSNSIPCNITDGGQALSAYMHAQGYPVAQVLARTGL
ncbi:MAG: hypothetical protein JKY94_17700 [Rhodobacteraceae bacterium]|nr:hypothetical protein [Paracoccaceae bacterium]